VLAAHPHAVQVGDDVARGIRVISATYGLNCGAAAGNETSVLRSACSGQACSYTINYRVIGDPVPGCAKDFRVACHCADGSARSAYAAPEAGFGSVVSMSCY
jgi:hypothetical protein